MNDPIPRLDQFRADASGAPMRSASDARRRGDQIRRRRRAVGTAGVAAVAAAVAGPIFFLSNGFGHKAVDPLPAASSEAPSTVAPTTSGDATASDTASAAQAPSDAPTATDAPAAGLGEANLPAADDLPGLDRFDSELGWNAYKPTPDVPTMACQKEWLSTLEPSDKVAGDYRWDTDSAMVGQVHVAVLDFADENAAGAAYNEIMEWQEVCPANKLGVDPQVTSLPTDVSEELDAGPKRAARSQATYPGIDGGDGAWFETELVAEYQARLVLVGYGEIAGPCPPSTGDKDDPCYQPDQPDSWPGRILEIEKAAVKAGISDLR